MHALLQHGYFKCSCYCFNTGLYLLFYFSPKKASFSPFAFLELYLEPSVAWCYTY